MLRQLFRTQLPADVQVEKRILLGAERSGRVPHELDEFPVEEHGRSVGQAIRIDLREVKALAVRPQSTVAAPVLSQLLTGAAARQDVEQRRWRTPLGEQVPGLGDRASHNSGGFVPIPHDTQDKVEDTPEVGFVQRYECLSISGP